MSDLVAHYALTSIHPPQTGVVLRAGTIVWREERTLIAVDGSGVRTIQADWSIESHEVTPDGQFVLAIGDDGKRAAVWEIRSGLQLLSLVGDEERRQSLRAGLGTIEGELFAFVAVRNKDVSIIAARGGEVRGWIATTGMMWFHVLQIAQLDPDWLAVLGYHDGEARDQAAVIRASETLQDPMVLYGALYERSTVSDWGYRFAIGPAGSGQAVVFRDPEWDPDDSPGDPTESFFGLVIWDLASAQVLQRLTYDGKIDSGVTIGADRDCVAIETPGHVEVVARDTGLVSRLDAVALDPYRLEFARMEGEAITIRKLLLVGS